MKYGIAYGDALLSNADIFETKEAAEAALPGYVEDGEIMVRGYGMTWQEYAGGRPHVVAIN